MYLNLSIRHINMPLAINGLRHINMPLAFGNQWVKNKASIWTRANTQPIATDIGSMMIDTITLVQ